MNWFHYFRKAPLFILSRIIILSLLPTSCATAQEVVLKGTCKQYSVKPLGDSTNYSFIWSVNGGTASEFGSYSTTLPILWDGNPGSYTIQTYPIDMLHQCAGNIRILNVKVVDFPVTWVDTISYHCPVYDHETLEFNLWIRFPFTTKSWSFTYKIDNTEAHKVIIREGNSKKITLPGLIQSTDSSGIEHIIRISSITLPEGNTIYLDGTETDSKLHKHRLIIYGFSDPCKIEIVREVTNP